MQPETRYAQSGKAGIAYQVFGEGDQDLVLSFQFISHLDLAWESPALEKFLNRLGSFARVIMFDRRGVGLSDPTAGAPTLEERTDDVRAVMDAAGSDRAALFGMSEGAATSMMFAATYPERTSALILWGAMARSTEAEDYPWAPSRETALESMKQLIAPQWGKGSTVEIFSPTLADNPDARALQARFEREAASPVRVWELLNLFLDLDVRDVLPLIQTPTLVMHRRSDYAVNVRAGRWLAEQIEGSQFVEYEGTDHNPWVADPNGEILEQIEEFVTGIRPTPTPDRVLSTVLFTDIVDSTQRASELGDQEWKSLLEDHQDLVRRHLKWCEGKEIKTTGDGFLATFDGPTRAIEAATAITDEISSLGIEVRAGIHTGELEIMGDDVGGIAVHVAARVCGLAGPGQVLASRTVRDLTAGSGIEFADWGRHELKGVPDSWELYDVTSTPRSNQKGPGARTSRHA
ncbi:MAG: adenylate/guanylate cyclase domain-containing protein [Solirubrobacterales bacterium]|nr:adenylate/guanylate cyclase domain-containing protein [Solirubrobacterales bacterium]